MYRVDRKTLEVELVVRLRTVLREQKSKLRMKLPGAQEEAEDAVIAKIIDVIDGPSSCVVRADMVSKNGGYKARGLFGNDEPWPAQLEMERHAKV